MSPGWDNWTRHEPEPHVLMFRRTIELAKKIRQEAKEREEQLRKEEAEEEARRTVELGVKLTAVSAALTTTTSSNAVSQTRRR